MITKKKLSEKIAELKELEERIIPLLNRHVASSLSFSAIDERELVAILGELKNRVVAQKKHIALLEGIQKELAGSKQDVY